MLKWELMCISGHFTWHQDLWWRHCTGHTYFQSSCLCSYKSYPSRSSYVGRSSFRSSHKTPTTNNYRIYFSVLIFRGGGKSWTNYSDAKGWKVSNDGVMRFKFNLPNELNSEAAAESKSDSSIEELFVHKRVNLHELHFYRSAGIKWMEHKKAKEKLLHKAHVTYGTCTRKLLCLFILLCYLWVNIQCQGTIQLKILCTQQIINWFGEANEHYDGTLNKLNYVSLMTDVSLKEVFTYHQAQKWSDWSLLVEAK